MSSNELTIKNFLGVNLKDAADKIKDNEFTKLQNLYQSSKGILSRRFGTVLDLSSVDLCSRISGVWRHYSTNQEQISIYHCVPDSTLLPDNTQDLTLTDITSAVGDIFGGGAVQPLSVCYSWIGRGMEQTYNSKNRVGFVAGTNSWLNAGHQTITLGANTNILRVQIPAFPTGITGANIFVGRGSPSSHATPTEMTYMGTITTSGGTLDIDSFIGPYAARNDSLILDGNVTAFNSPQGQLKRGTYWIAAAWVTDPNFNEDGTSFAAIPVKPGVDSVSDTLGASGASSNTAGSLSASTTYNFIVSVVDSNTNTETFVSTVIPVATAVGKSSVDITIPSLPQGAGDTSTFNLYFGSNGGTLYQVNSSPIKPNTLYNQGTLPTTGTKSPLPINPYHLTASLSAIQVNVAGSSNAITVDAPSTSSTNGAKAVYIFFGTQPPSVQPMTCVGVAKVNGGYVDIFSMPHHNAQSCPEQHAAETDSPRFYHAVNAARVGGVNVLTGSRVLSRFGFLMGKSATDGTYEIFPSRTLLYMMLHYLKAKVYAGDDWVQIPAKPIDLHNFVTNPRTQNDLYKNGADSSYVQPFSYNDTIYDPQFCFKLGVSYFSNGIDIPWQTDGFTLGQLSCVRGAAVGSGSNTDLPPIPRFIFEYQGSLIVAGAKAGNQIFASNANAPQNWATFGSGSLLRFVSIGDAVGSGVTAFGIFTPISSSTDNPSSFMIAFKKNGTWMKAQITDPTTSIFGGVIGGQVGAPLIQISGKVGCTAPRTVAQTSKGTVFLGSDANVYLIRQVSEPIKIGTKIQNALAHLTENDAWMQLCTAVEHNNHYKLSFPSVAATKAGTVVNDSEFWLDLRDQEEGDPMTWVGPHTGRNIGAQVVLVGDGDDLSRLVADGSSVRTMIADTVDAIDDLGTAITCIAQSKIFRFNKEAHVKRLMGAIIDMYIDMGYTNNLLFQGFADSDYQQVNRQLSSGAGVWDSSQWDQSNYADASWQGYSFLFGGTNLTGRTIQFAIQNSDIAPFVLASVTMLLKSERRRIIN